MSNNLIIEDFYKKLVNNLNLKNFPVGLHEPFFDKKDELRVLKTIKDGWVSYQGEMVKEFEKRLESYLSVNHAILVTSGTSGLFLSLKALGIGEGDEVIVPSLTFVATANAVCQTGAIPNFVDSSDKNFNIDTQKLEKYLIKISKLNNKGERINKFSQRKIKAIIPVHVFGSSCDLDEVCNIGKKFKLKIIEDSTEALGSKYKKKKISTYRDLGVISFNGNKIITTGGGGVILTNNKNVAKKINHLSSTAKVKHLYEFKHNKIAYNLRLPALNAAIGISQLEKINFILMKKKKLYLHYKKIFKNCNYGKIFNPNFNGESNNWINSFILEDKYSNYKNKLLKFLNNKGILARPLWIPLNQLKIFRNFPSDNCENSNLWYSKVICLPSSVNLVGKL